jgi:hypothetical protein
VLLDGSPWQPCVLGAALVVLQADSLAALSKQQATNVTLLGECVKMRRPVYKQLMGNALTSAPVRRAVYR